MRNRRLSKFNTAVRLPPGCNPNIQHTHSAREREPVVTRLAARGCRAARQKTALLHTIIVYLFRHPSSSHVPRLSILRVHRRQRLHLGAAGRIGSDGGGAARGRLGCCSEGFNADGLELVHERVMHHDALLVECPDRCKPATFRSGQRLRDSWHTYSQKLSHARGP